VFSSGESGVPFNYAMVNTPLTSGRHSWSITLVEGRGANVAFGVSTARFVSSWLHVPFLSLACLSVCMGMHAFVLVRCVSVCCWCVFLVCVLVCFGVFRCVCVLASESVSLRVCVRVCVSPYVSVCVHVSVLERRPAPFARAHTLCPSIRHWGQFVVVDFGSFLPFIATGLVQPAGAQLPSQRLHVGVPG
jgi:hypothetical protein